MKTIAVFSQLNDLHGRVVFAALEKRPGVRPLFVATDALFQSGRLSWAENACVGPVIGAHFGIDAPMSEIDVLWWRRVNQPQIGIDTIPDPVAQELVDREWQAATFGIVMDSFPGVFVNNPLADAMAGNKIYQLSVASRSGFRVPKTLVSQIPEKIRAFCHELGGSVIVKKLVGSVQRPLATLLLTLEDLDDDDEIRMCPSIYQERINGDRHLRVCCFGDRVLAAEIKTDILDWRRDMSVDFRPFALESRISDSVVALIKSLGLQMGIMDMMITHDDQLVWIELNPQGQFLFIEGKCGMDITNPFVDFLISQQAAVETPRQSLHA